MCVCVIVQSGNRITVVWLMMIFICQRGRKHILDNKLHLVAKLFLFESALK